MLTLRAFGEERSDVTPNESVRVNLSRVRDRVSTVLATTEQQMKDVNRTISTLERSLASVIAEREKADLKAREAAREYSDFADYLTPERTTPARREQLGLLEKEKTAAEQTLTARRQEEDRFRAQIAEQQQLLASVQAKRNELQTELDQTDSEIRQLS